MKKDYTFELKDATGIGMQTLVGSYGTFPRTGGNCFSISVDGYDRDLHVANFYVENLEELLDNRGLTWPVKVHVIGKGQCVIQDSRIEDDWYRKDFCSICTPNKLLPLPQRLEFGRKIDRGDVEINDYDGGSIIITKFNAPPRKLKEKWTLEEMKSEVFVGEDVGKELAEIIAKETDAGFFHCPYIPKDFKKPD